MLPVCLLFSSHFKDIFQIKKTSTKDLYGLTKTIEKQINLAWTMEKRRKIKMKMCNGAT